MNRTLLITTTLIALLLCATLGHSQSGHSVTGTVTVSGRPTADATVTVRIGSRVLRSRTGNDGRYYIGGLRAGSYRFVATKDARSAARSVQVPDESVVDFEL